MPRLRKAPKRYKQAGRRASIEHFGSKILNKKAHAF